MIILDLSLSHSFAHQIDPKNGLNLSFLLPLCSFTLASVMGEGHILAFDTDYSYLTFIFGPKNLYVKNVIIIKDFIEYSNHGTFSTVPVIAKSADDWMRTICAFPFWKMYQNVKQSSLLKNVRKDNVKMFIKGLN